MKSLKRYSDDELIKLIAEDNEKAFEALFDRHWETAHFIARSKLKSREVAQEIVDDLFISFWQRRHTLQIDNFQHYLRVAIKYKVLTYIRLQLARDKHFLDYQEQLPVQSEETLKSVEYNDLLRALEDGMKSLPEKTQEVFRLSRLEGRTVSEIANQLKVSEKAIEYHITRSRKELRFYLKDFLILFLSTGSFILH